MQELLTCINVAVLIYSGVILLQAITKLIFVFPFHSRSHKILNVLFPFGTLDKKFICLLL